MTAFSSPMRNGAFVRELLVCALQEGPAVDALKDLATRSASQLDLQEISTVAAVWMIQRLSGESARWGARALSNFKYPGISTAPLSGRGGERAGSAGLAALSAPFDTNRIYHIYNLC
ncbi:uncharacterized protein ATNIH1004_006955 [Aspergillus tanneri]|uniref:Uncharacterized protein n=1 Tax=Aspergillus tanneri TaxID=1220188 RepID=A0A5M9MI84_9EURO|nr:uncharacterized protein ATNIH1004_006955 [Aspergillus tanneri]KAA8645536.1 hypothetical protein ATNIH1004_006955 [Aspergillus tanneri]